MRVFSTKYCVRVSTILDITEEQRRCITKRKLDLNRLRMYTATTKSTSPANVVQKSRLYCNRFFSGMRKSRPQKSQPFLFCLSLSSYLLALVPQCLLSTVQGVQHRRTILEYSRLRCNRPRQRSTRLSGAQIRRYRRRK